jgi:hypothetical protein
VDGQENLPVKCVNFEKCLPTEKWPITGMCPATQKCQFNLILIFCLSPKQIPKVSFVLRDTTDNILGRPLFFSLRPKEAANLQANGPGHIHVCARLTWSPPCKTIRHPPAMSFNSSCSRFARNWELVGFLHFFKKIEFSFDF